MSRISKKRSGQNHQGGGGMWNLYQHSHFFFHRSGWPPPHPPLPNIVCFPSSNVFFECFLVIWAYFLLIRVPIPSIYLTINFQDPHHARKCSMHNSLLGGTYVRNYWKQQVLWAPSLPPIPLPGLMQIGSGHIFKRSHGPLIDSWTRQTLTEGSAQPPEHQNVPPLPTLTRSPNCFRTLIFGFKHSKTLRIGVLSFNYIPLPPWRVCHFRRRGARYSHSRLPLAHLSCIPPGTTPGPPWSTMVAGFPPSLSTKECEGGSLKNSMRMSLRP